MARHPKRILITAATAFELTAVQRIIGLRADMNITYFVHHVGIPLAMYHLTTMLSTAQHSFDCMIQVGIAGRLNQNINIGDVCIIEKDYFGDMGVVEDNSLKTLFDLKLISENAFPFENGCLRNPHLQHFYLPHTKPATAVTVQQITTQATMIHHYTEQYQADIESMEGAVFHYLALQHRIPFIQLRGISNDVGVRDKNEWRIQLPLNNIGTVLRDSLDQFV